MPTSVHIPKPLLEAVDRRAKRLKVSRNRLIVTVLEREMSRETEWAPAFFEELRKITPEEAASVDALFDAVFERRSTKKAPRL